MGKDIGSFINQHVDSAKTIINHHVDSAKTKVKMEAPVTPYPQDSKSQHIHASRYTNQKEGEHSNNVPIHNLFHRS